MLATVTSAVALYTGQEQLAIDERLKEALRYATPFVSVAVGALARMKVGNARVTKAENHLFRSEAFKKEN